MKTLNYSNMVKQQYRTAANLNTRISIHARYSTNKQGFGNWIAANYDIKPKSCILELGGGTGDMWREHLDLLEEGSKLVLTDFSEGMLETAKAALGCPDSITYQKVDIQEIPFIDNSFDVVIANMMLYHVPDIHKGLSEVRRVLKQDGIFYCATYGQHGIIEYIADLLRNFGVEDTVNKEFTLQNGGDILRKHFDTVTRLDYEDSLAVTNIDDMIDYIKSCTSMTNVADVEETVLRAVLESKMQDGVLHIPKEYGMFVCKG